MNYTLITGASSGIGYEFARIFASHGHSLILVARSTDKLEALKADLEKKTEVSIHVITCDLSVQGSATELFQKTQNLGLHVDILVNNAGLGDYGLFVNSKIGRVREMIHVNILALTELTHLYLPAMLAQKSGRILNVASVASFQPGPLMTVYYATKAFVLSFTEGLHEELQGTGLTTTALCPGPTKSDFLEKANLSQNIALMNALKIPSSFEVAEYGYHQMMKGEVIAVHGFMNKILSLGVSFAPRALVRKVVKKIQSERAV